MLPSSKSPLFASVGCSVNTTVTAFDPDAKLSRAKNTIEEHRIIKEFLKTIGMKKEKDIQRVVDLYIYNKEEEQEEEEEEEEEEV